MDLEKLYVRFPDYVEQINAYLRREGRDDILTNLRIRMRVDSSGMGETRSIQFPFEFINGRLFNKYDYTNSPDKDIDEVCEILYVNQVTGMEYQQLEAIKNLLIICNVGRTVTYGGVRNCLKTRIDPTDSDNFEFVIFPVVNPFDQKPVGRHAVYLTISGGGESDSYFLGSVDSRTVKQVNAHLLKQLRMKEKVITITDWEDPEITKIKKI